jgi:hypothetical protein
MDLFARRGGVPVLSRPSLKPALRREALNLREAGSFIRPAGYTCSPDISFNADNGGLTDVDLASQEGTGRNDDLRSAEYLAVFFAFSAVT